MKRRAPVALVLLLAAIAGGCGGTSGAGAGAADLVPATAPAFIAVDTNPESAQWSKVDELARRFPDKAKAIRSLKEQLRKEDGLDYDRDVKPALGSELDVVWLDFENGGQNVVGLTQPGDKQKFEALVRKGNARSDSGDKLVSERFKGWEVLSNKQATIDRFKRESDAAVTTLADTKTFKDAVGSAHDDALMRAYVSGPQTMAAIRRAGGAEAQKVIDTLGALDWVRAELQATSDGVRLDTNVHGTPGKIFKGAITRGFEPKLPNSVPQDALIYYTFHGSGSILGALDKNPGLAGPGFRQFRGIFRQIGALLAGEDALYVRPSGGQIPEITLVTEPKAGTDGAGTVDRLLKQYRADIGVVPRHGTVAGLPARTLHFGEFAVHYANVDGRFVLTTAPAGLAGAKSGGKALAQSENYRDAVDASGLPARTQGFVYVNVSGGVGLAKKLLGGSIPADVARNIKPLRSAMEYAVSHTHELQITLFLRIK